MKKITNLQDSKKGRRKKSGRRQLVPAEIAWKGPRCLSHGVVPAAALVLSLPFSLYSTVESLCCPSWRNQIPLWERSIPRNSWLGGYRYCAWHRFPLAATQAPPQPTPAQRVESLTYTTHGFSSECKEKFKAFRKTRMRYKETHQHFPLKPLLVIQTLQNCWSSYCTWCFSLPCLQAFSRSGMSAARHFSLLHFGITRISL